MKVRGKAIHVQTWRGPEVSRKFRFIGFQTIGILRLQGFSAVRTVRLYPEGNIPDIHFGQRLRRSQGHTAAERIKSMKNSNDTKRNRTRTFQFVAQCLNYLLHRVPKFGRYKNKIQEAGVETNVKYRKSFKENVQKDQGGREV